MADAEKEQMLAFSKCLDKSLNMYVSHIMNDHRHDANARLLLAVGFESTVN
jgi:hypothetical protein